MGKMAWKDAETLHICVKWKACTICILHQYGAAAWPFHHGEPIADLPKVSVPPGDRPAVLRQVRGRQWTAIGRTQTWALSQSQSIRSTVCPNHMRDRVCHPWSSRWHSKDMSGIYWVTGQSLCPISQADPHVYMCRRQHGLGKGCFSEKASVLGPSISHPMSSCISCCSQLVCPRH